MFRSTITLYCALISLASAGARGQQPETVTVSSKPSCPKCQIRLDTVVTLVEDSVLGGVSAGMWLEPDRQGRWYSLERKPFRFIIFDRSGKPIKTFGREGEGPWEYQFPYHPRVLGDTIYIQDNSLGRLTLLTLDAKPIRMVPIGHHSGSVELLGDGSMFAIPGLEVNGGPATPIQRLDRAGKLIRLIAVDPARKGHYFTSRLASRTGANVWVGSWNRYRLDRWDTGGKLVSTLVRDADWFPDYDLREASRKPLDGLPRPRLISAREDDRGLLWIVINVADASWGANAEKIRADRAKYMTVARGAEGSAEVPSPEARQMLHDTVIEVIDLRTGRLVVSRRFDQEFLTYINGGYLPGYYEDDDGLPHVPIMRLRLEGYRK